MIRPVFPRLSIARLTAAVLVTVALACQSAQAQVVPFGIIGGGSGPDGLSMVGNPSPHNSTGVATLLGKYSGTGDAEVLTFDPTTGAGTFKGHFTFVAANGDKLACTYGDTSNGAEEVGTFQLHDLEDGSVYVEFIAEFNPILNKCTGRFAKVIDGSFEMYAVTDPFALELNAEGNTPPFDYGWLGDGWLEFGR